MNLPPRFCRTIQEVFGETGQLWLQNLPNLLTYCEQRWQIKALPPFTLSYNYVAPAIRSNGSELVLKLGVPNPELSSEIASLRLFAGQGINKLLDADEEQGILLLECLRPGIMLSTLENDEQATAIAAVVMRQLWQPLPQQHPFKSVADWAQGMHHLRATFAGGTGPFPPGLVDLAERLFSELLASMAEPMLLHGDLHHMNILSAQREPWLAIDPKGIVGEPVYETGAFLRNPCPKIARSPDLKPILARRVAQLADLLGFDRQRIIAWGIAQAVLSAWWSYEDHGHGWEPVLVIAKTLNEL